MVKRPGMFSDVEHSSLTEDSHCPLKTSISLSGIEKHCSALKNFIKPHFNTLLIIVYNCLSLPLPQVLVGPAFFTLAPC